MLKSFHRVNKRHQRLADEDDEPSASSHLIREASIEGASPQLGSSERVRAHVEEQHSLIQLLLEFRSAMAEGISGNDILTSPAFTHVLSRLRAAQQMQVPFSLKLLPKLAAGLQRLPTAMISPYAHVAAGSDDGSRSTASGLQYYVAAEPAIA